MEKYEKLGSFYIGRSYNMNKNEIIPEKILYDSKDLTTHAVCVGMTGSGKTGLCIGLIEEAAMDGIPSLIIDPKGDMANLLLSFPNLAPDDFKPWVNTDEAKRRGMSTEDFAKDQAELWKNGLSKWDQTGERISNLRKNTKMSVYTPGSTSGIPVSILKSFAAPPKEIIQETELFGEQVSSTVSSLLGLIGVDADPIQSREHILLSSILSYYWKKGTDLDLTMLIQSVQNPPFNKVGVFDLQSFYPSKERFELAMSLNNLLAAPGFQPWLKGVSMDIKQLLYTEEGKPKTSIFYIAHLSDEERMFFVSLFLNQVLSWVRRQPGTSSLRALLYFDEIFGYLPPVKNPPTKKPLLTLLKQARAFGLGLVLATQNPVDVDYKGLSNTGTWFIGRLQTERDRDRVLDGLLSASGSEKESYSKSELSKIISNLDKRVFFLHNVHEEEPVILHTRWVMSYLRGPLTRIQISELMENQKQEIKEKDSLIKTEVSGTEQRPVLDPEIRQLFLPVRTPKPLQASLMYVPHIWASAEIHFRDESAGVDLKKYFRLLTPIRESVLPVDWSEAKDSDLIEDRLESETKYEAEYKTIPSAARNKDNYKQWEKDFKDYLYTSRKIELFESETFDEVSKPGETERDFRVRLSHIAREKRDEEAEKLRKKYDKKVNSIQKKIDRAEDKVEKEKDQVSQHKLKTAVSIGATLLGAFLGRKRVSRTTVNDAGRTIRKFSRTMQEKYDVQRAKDRLYVLNEDLDKLEKEFEEELEKNVSKYDALKDELKTIIVHPTKAAIDVKFVNFVWVPYWTVAGTKSSMA